MNSSALVPNHCDEITQGYKTRFVPLTIIPHLNHVWYDALLACVAVPCYAPFPTSYDPLRKPSNAFLQQSHLQHEDPP